MGEAVLRGVELRTSELAVSGQRSRDQRRHVALVVASLVLDNPELAGRDAAETELNECEVLSDVLGALGYQTKSQVTWDDVRREQVTTLRRRQHKETAVTQAPVEFARRRGESRVTCGDDQGTERGYRRHLAAYAVPCGDCLRWRTDQLTERWLALGVNPESEVVIPT